MSYPASNTNTEVRQGVALRNKVYECVKNDLESAHKLATSIKHPWYRCQALAEVADKSPINKIDSILEQAFSSAMQCHDQNRRVTVACWPLRTSIKHDRNKLASLFLKQCIGQIDQEMDPLSKWCAVDVLYTIKSNSYFLNIFFDTFKGATSKGHGWRVERMINFMLSNEDIQSDPRYIEHLEYRKKEIAEWKQCHGKG